LLYSRCFGIAICNRGMTFPATDVINSGRYAAKNLIDALPVDRAAHRRR
jgi:hypothetical protein